MTHDDLRELMLLYVADALDTDERAQIDARLDAGDPAAMSALTEAEETLGHLPLALNPLTPSAGMWQRLESELESDDQLALDRVPVQPKLESKTDSSPGSSSLAWYFVPWALAAALALITVSLSLTHSSMQADFNQLRVEVTDLNNQLVTSNGQISELRIALAESNLQSREVEARIAAMNVTIAALTNDLDRANILVDLLKAENLKLATLAGTENMPDAKGRALWDQDQRRLFLAVNSLEVPDPDRYTYQLWFVTDDESSPPISLGIMATNPDGTITYDASYPEIAARVKLVAISREPAGGSPEPGPTGPIVMAGPPQLEPAQ